MFLAVNHVTGTLKCDNLIVTLHLFYVLVESPPVSPVVRRVQPLPSLPIEDLVQINNGRRLPEWSCPCIRSRHHFRAVANNAKMHGSRVVREELL